MLARQLVTDRSRGWWARVPRGTLGAAARGAILAALAWAGATALGLADVLGLAPTRPYFWAAVVGAALGTLGVHSRAVQRVTWTAAAAVAGMLVAVTSLPIAATIAPTLVRRDRPAADSGGAVDAVAVLSAAMTDDGLVKGEGVDRLLDGFALAQRTGRPLLVSVIHPRHTPAVSSLADQQRLAAVAGLADRLWAVDSVHTTRDEAIRMAALARARGWQRVALVTSPAHTRRACATFERAGLAVVCTPAHARDAAWGGPDPLRTPADRLRVVGSWLYEELGWYLYHARGWV